MTSPTDLYERDRMSLHDTTVDAVEALRLQHPDIDHQALAEAIFHAMVQRLTLGREGVEALIASMTLQYRIGQPALVIGNSDDA